VIPRSERPDLELDEGNCVTACASHHPTLEAVRRLLIAIIGEAPARCPHRHPYESGRRACEERLRREKLERRARQLARAA
jgi:hypothetical protein